MDKGTGSCRVFAADVLADILMRLPPNTRRRLRLVCRHWRHVVETRTATDLRNRAKTVVFTGEARNCFKGMSVVGTCNGLICLCDDQKRGGSITLVNPVTGGTLSIPPLPSPYAGDSRKWHQTYSFAYHPTTERYKIVHIPQNLDRVLVFTFGEASWRDVPMLGRAARCDLDAGVVSADGYVYMVVEDTEARIMSFDVNHENFTSIGPLPNILSKSGSWGLTEVHGRLGIAFTHVSQTLAKTEVWVMEGMLEKLKWNCWYILQVHKLRNEANWQWRRCRHYLAHPHFAHSGKQVLTRTGGGTLFRHVPIDDTRKARHGIVEINEKSQGKVINNLGTYYWATATLCYVETKQPLSVYKCW